MLTSFVIVCAAHYVYSINQLRASKKTRNAPFRNLVVNYHFLRQCNYSCKFCFHQDIKDDTFVLPLEDAKRGLRRFKENGMTRVNFSGGEPFLKAKHLGQLCIFCKTVLQIQVSIVSNGSLISRDWMEKYASYVDVMAVSCDSFDPATLKAIGRGLPRDKTGEDHLKQLKQICSWCNDFDVGFKINTVVCALNVHETIVDYIMMLKPIRWKVFQCLLIEGENWGENCISEKKLRNAQSMVVSDEDFNNYVQRNQCAIIVPENNTITRNSYLILDERMCLLNNESGSKVPTESILDVEDIRDVLKKCGFDKERFKERDGEWKTNELQYDI